MFGPKLFIKTRDIGVYLVPYKKEYASIFADLSSSTNVKMFTGGPYGHTVEDEESAYEGLRTNKTAVYWALIPEGSKNPIGYTGIQGIRYDGSAHSEIMIFDQEWWGKGMATQSHIARNWYAAKHLNRYIINSSASEGNKASIKALENIGYFETGRKLRVYFRNNRYYDDICMSWINPFRADVLYPEGIPSSYKKYVDIAQDALDLADKNVKLL